jgi:FlaA1/EpsC-like NDP-sugar epimerase
MDALYSGKTILVTGAGGCIGSAITKSLLKFGPRLLILLDNSEYHLYAIQLELAAIPSCSPYVIILGDVCDGRLLADVFERHRPDIIFHSAAFKHVGILETNPFEAIRNNTIGALSLAKAAVQYEAANLLVISTDKAVNPCNVLGVSKRMAELVSIRWGSVRTRINVLRLANIFGSPGSVVPLFLQQISQGGPVTVSHPEVRRYFVPLNDAVDLVLRAAGLAGNAEIFLPKLGEPIKILDLARRLIHEATVESGKTIPIVFTGLRPGDKMTEDFLSAADSVIPTSDSRLGRIGSPSIAPGDFDASMAELLESLSNRDLSRLLAILCRLVPEYQPSELLLGMASRPRR